MSLTSYRAALPRDFLMPHRQTNARKTLLFSFRRPHFAVAENHAPPGKTKIASVRGRTISWLFMETRSGQKAVDLAAYDTSALKERLGALRRYL